MEVFSTSLWVDVGVFERFDFILSTCLVYEVSVVTVGVNLKVERSADDALDDVMVGTSASHFTGYVDCAHTGLYRQRLDLALVHDIGFDWLHEPNRSAIPVLGIQPSAPPRIRTVFVPQPQ